MTYEYKRGTFSLFRNDKGGNEKRPDYRGEGMDLEGNHIEVAAWLREGNKGKFMSCTFKPKADKQRDAKQQPKKGGAFDELESDVPF